MNYIWLLPLVPAAGAAINGLVGIRWFQRRVAAALACASMTAAFALAVFAAFDVGRVPDGREASLGFWIPPIPLATARGIQPFTVQWSLLIDPLASVMILIVTGIGLLIHIYATAYMNHEPRGGYARFFCYMNLFCAFMLLLVLGANFPVMFIGWEGVGLCSYLLIGFWYEKTTAASAGLKAFLVNRIGDWGFLLGMLAVFFTFATMDFRALAAQAGTWPIETSHFGTLSVICLLLFVGATGKSAQIPLFVWLPDAMAGPTPVSALIHAATMVTAGVYMVARNAVLFSHAPLVLTIVAIVGALTALMAATIALAQNDIKRVLAYSTVSQLGYMFLAAGVGAFSAAMFHLMTHAFFKALLFLAAGVVIHSLAGEQDMRRMGGLKRYLPVTFVTMMIGALALAGIPPLSGFFSKDEILLRAFETNRLLWLLGSLTAVLTAFYMFRLIALTFYGAYRGPAHSAEWRGPQEPAGAMTVPLMALAIGAIVAGFIGIPAALGGRNAFERFLAPSFAQTRALATHQAASPHLDASPAQAGALMLFAALLAILGIAAAWRFYVDRPGVTARLASRWPGLDALLRNKYYVDEFYGAIVVRSTLASARGLWRFDRRVIDGAVNAWGWSTRILAWLSYMFDKVAVDGLVNAVGRGAGEGSAAVRRGQTGLVQNYALLIVLGVCVFLTAYLIAR